MTSETICKISTRGILDINTFMLIGPELMDLIHHDRNYI